MILYVNKKRIINLYLNCYFCYLNYSKSRVEWIWMFAITFTESIDVSFITRIDRRRQYNTFRSIAYDQKRLGFRPMKPLIYNVHNELNFERIAEKCHRRAIEIGEKRHAFVVPEDRRETDLKMGRPKIPRMASKRGTRLTWLWSFSRRRAATGADWTRTARPPRRFPARPTSCRSSGSSRWPRSRTGRTGWTPGRSWPARSPTRAPTLFCWPASGNSPAPTNSAPSRPPPPPPPPPGASPSRRYRPWSTIPRCSWNRMCTLIVTRGGGLGLGPIFAPQIA